jgi:hypothetical protein
VLLLCCVSISCANNKNENKTVTTENKSKPADPETVFDKLLGTWQSEGGKNFERWTSKDNGKYQSVVFSVKGSDTSWNEQAEIYREKDKWVFENMVKGQNEGKAVRFISVILNDSTVQFSNPLHDFPTDVHYTVSGANTVNAFIIGPNSKGGRDTIPFNYTRVQ